MLQRLRHYPIVGRHYEEDEVDPGGPREHVVDESLVTRNIDKAEHGAIRCGQVGKAEIDRDAACLFFFEPIGIDTRERPDERSLAVINVTGSSDDHDAAPGSAAAARASASAISCGARVLRTASRNGEASALPPLRARNSKANAATW